MSRIAFFLVVIMLDAELATVHEHELKFSSLSPSLKHWPNEIATHERNVFSKTVCESKKCELSWIGEGLEHYL